VQSEPCFNLTYEGYGCCGFEPNRFKFLMILPPVPCRFPEQRPPILEILK
jgi:hypothetical protein